MERKGFLKSLATLVIAPKAIAVTLADAVTLAEPTTKNEFEKAFTRSLPQFMKNSVYYQISPEMLEDIPYLKSYLEEII
jgi:hypothetical protein